MDIGQNGKLAKQKKGKMREWQNRKRAKWEGVNQKTTGWKGGDLRKGRHRRVEKWYWSKLIWGEMRKGEIAKRQNGNNFKAKWEGKLGKG